MTQLLITLLQVFDTLRTEVSLIRSRAPLLSEHIKWKAQQLCEWAEILLVDAQSGARESAHEVGEALSAADPPD